MSHPAWSRYRTAVKGSRQNIKTSQERNRKAWNQIPVNHHYFWQTTVFPPGVSSIVIYIHQIPRNCFPTAFNNMNQFQLSVQPRRPHTNGKVGLVTEVS